MDAQCVRRFLQTDIQLVVPPCRDARDPPRDAFRQERLQVGLEMQRLERTEQGQLTIIRIARGAQ